MKEDESGVHIRGSRWQKKKNKQTNKEDESGVHVGGSRWKKKKKKVTL